MQSLNENLHFNKIPGESLAPGSKNCSCPQQAPGRQGLRLTWCCLPTGPGSLPDVRKILSVCGSVATALSYL